ncbi:acetyl-CoA acetyltransferase [Sphingobium sp. CR2-8]|uniref:acetyl-CoA acetyltransferase n=1 Tax=Sphingobium sp. CR2-8 TaxID=1306534 RepID=UPI002DBB9283|nr:acetyl-CoA acetyltransferase [Sphingobium sp. CR2-8]MEC3911874.1 acetyl-CoA acetyltransferase [Sphingobium sp. CR2-8]
MTASIIGWGHTPFGKLAGDTLETLIVAAANEALDHAGVDPADIDAIFVGHFNSGFSRQSLTAGLVLQASPAFRFKPATRTENACASGSAAVHQGLTSILAGRARNVLVVGVEKMTDTIGDAVGNNLLGASFIPEEGEVSGGFAGLFGKIATAYYDRHGDQSDALAMIAAKNHRNGVRNPWAQLRKDLGYDFCRQESDRNPIVAGPLKRTDCSPVSDGAAALVLASDDVARSARRAVAFRAASHVQDYLPMSRRNAIQFEGCSKAWAKAFDDAGLTLDDLSLVETHDCFTIAELIEYEAMGLTPEGQGSRAIREGWTEIGGRLPVNASGGLKAKGHPIGATGVSMHVLSAMQLCHAAPEGMQIDGAELAGVFNMGGTAVANYVSILERTR